MIRITVEMLPGGYEENKKTIASAVIYNTAEFPPGHTRGHYKARLYLRNKKKIWRTATTRNFPRKSKNVWYLLKRILEDALG